jgi:hypothetical protein
MKSILLYAVTPAIIASAALLLSVRSFNADTLAAGYTCVAGVGAIMALDYRVSWKALIGR